MIENIYLHESSFLIDFSSSKDATKLKIEASYILCPLTLIHMKKENPN